MISVAELDRAVADAGIGEVLFEQTLIIEGIPLTKRQRQRKHGATKGTDVQKERITAALASAYGVLVRHVKVLASGHTLRLQCHALSAERPGIYSESYSD